LGVWYVNNIYNLLCIFWFPNHSRAKGIVLERPLSALKIQHYAENLVVCHENAYAIVEVHNTLE